MNLLIVFLLVSIFINLSCDRCGNLKLLPYECPGPYGNNYCMLKVLDRKTRNNLVFGKTAKYKFKDFILIGINDTLQYCDTFKIRNCGMTISYFGGDSVISIIPTFHNYPYSYDLKLSSVESDSLTFYFEEFTNDCCKSYSSLTNAKINNEARIDLKDSTTIVIWK